jgi:hypothetical protein
MSDNSNTAIVPRQSAETNGSGAIVPKASGADVVEIESHEVNFAGAVASVQDVLAHAGLRASRTSGPAHS